MTYATINAALFFIILISMKKHGINIYNPALFIFGGNLFYNFVLFPIGSSGIEALSGDFDLLYALSNTYMLSLTFFIITGKKHFKIDKLTNKTIHLTNIINIDRPFRHGTTLLIAALSITYLFQAIYFGAINPIEIFSQGAALKHQTQGESGLFLLSIFNGLITTGFGFTIHRYYEQKISLTKLIISLSLSMIAMTYLGSKGILLFPIYMWFIIRANYYDKKTGLQLATLITTFIVAVPLLDILRFDRDLSNGLLEGIYYNFFRRTWDNIYVASQIVNSPSTFSAINPIQIFAEQFVPRAIFPSKSYPFEAVMTSIIMGENYGEGYIWKADIGGIPEFFLTTSHLGVILLGIMNGYLLLFYMHWLHKAKTQRNITSHIIAIFSIGTYSAFNIGISAKLLDLIMHFLWGLVPIFIVKLFELLAIRAKQLSNPHDTKQKAIN